MILFEACSHDEGHPAYQQLQFENLNRQYDFLRSAVVAALAVQRPYLSQSVIKALNFHAITCLHTNAGEFRPCPVHVGTGGDQFDPPEHYRVQALMDDFVNQVNYKWNDVDPVVMASYVLWRMNWIHPFINGNGRTARVACYYTLCLYAGGWLPGRTILPELIRQNREAYVEALKKVDASAGSAELNLQPVHSLLSDLLSQQLATAAT